MSWKRKLKRTKKKSAEKDIKQKLNMFDRIPEKCMMCEKVFDKTDKEQVKSWYVVERRQQKSVNLYCPTCWGEGTAMVKQISEEQELKKPRKTSKLDYFMRKVRQEAEDLRKRKENSDEQDN